MIIYNVTIKLLPEVLDDWIHWMKVDHIPKVMQTGYFEDCKMLKLLTGDEDGVTYAIQYRCQNMDTLNKYLENDSKALQAEHSARYKDSFVAFRTLLEEQHAF